MVTEDVSQFDKSDVKEEAEENILYILVTWDVSQPLRSSSNSWNKEHRVPQLHQLTTPQKSFDVSVTWEVSLFNFLFF